MISQNYSWVNRNFGRAKHGWGWDGSEIAKSAKIYTFFKNFSLPPFLKCRFLRLWLSARGGLGVGVGIREADFCPPPRRRAVKSRHRDFPEKGSDFVQQSWDKKGFEPPRSPSCLDYIGLSDNKLSWRDILKLARTYFEKNSWFFSLRAASLPAGRHSENFIVWISIKNFTHEN